MPNRSLDPIVVAFANTTEKARCFACPCLWRFLLLVCLICLLSQAPFAANIIRVPGDYPTIHQAIDAAQATDQVWVNEGTYSETISLKTEVGVYGGFVGTETTITQRDTATHPTILDGSKASNGQPAEHVVTVEGATSCTLDGFVVTGGKGAPDPEEFGYSETAGGGVYAFNGNARFANCVFSGNQTVLGSAGYIKRSQVEFENCQIHDNKSQYDALRGNESSITIRSCLIYANDGGIYSAGNYERPHKPDCQTIVEKTIICGNKGGGLRISYSTPSNVQISDSLIAANSNGTSAAYSYVYAKTANIQNCIFSEGSYERAFTFDATTLTLTNCLFNNWCTKSNQSGDYYSVELAAYCLMAANNIFVNAPHASIFLDAYETSLQNNLFHNNQHACQMYVYNQAWPILDTPNEINLQIPGAVQNMSGAPLFVMDNTSNIRKSWTASPKYDAASNRTILRGDDGRFIPRALANQIVNPDISQSLEAFIVDNTSSTLIVAGDARSYAPKNATFRIMDYHLQNGSAALDRADASLAPSVDMEENARPGVDNLCDVGPYEASPELEPVADKMPPVSQVKGLPDLSTSATIPVSFAAGDSESGVRFVELYYMRDNAGWIKYGDTFTTSPIMFDSSQTGGDGFYQFISFATDNAGNKEPWPTTSDDFTRIITHYDSLRIYVNSNNRDVGDGRSWNQALKTISQAMQVARMNAGAEIWVAAGKYRECVFVPSNIALYGSFTGNEADLRQRKYWEHSSVITPPNDDSVSESSGFIIRDGMNIRIDGFSIESGKGMAILPNYYGQIGGGICSQAAQNIWIANCTISGSLGNGNDIYCEKSDVNFVSCSSYRRGTRSGVNLYLRNGSSILRSCTFSGGSVYSQDCTFLAENVNFVSSYVIQCALGIYNTTATLSNCTISDIRSMSSSYEGASVEIAGKGKTALSNCIIANSQTYGILAQTTPTITNCLFWGNAKGAYSFSGKFTCPTALDINKSVPNARQNIDGNPAFASATTETLASQWTKNSIYVEGYPVNKRMTAYDSTAEFTTNSLTNRILQVTTEKKGNIDLVVTSNTLTSVTFELTDYDSIRAGTRYTLIDYHLSPISPAIDAGAKIPGLSDDIDGEHRPIQGGFANRGDGSGYDIGADEFPGKPDLSHPPARPVNISPSDGATSIPISPVLNASDFIDTNTADTHLMSQWQVSRDLSFAKPIIDSHGTIDALTHYAVSSPLISNLYTYYWRVRYRDSSFGWSEWSLPTAFTTGVYRTYEVPRDFSTLQQALDSALDASEIVLYPGVYCGGFSFSGKDLIIRSTNPEDPAIVSSTIIDAQGQPYGIHISGKANKRTVIAGLTIKNADGSGICGSKSYYLTVKSNLLTRNRIGIFGLQGDILDNQIRDGERGIVDVGGTIIGNLVTCNSVKNPDELGCGISGCSGYIAKNIVTFNTSKQGSAGIFGYGQILHNVVFGNSGGGISCYNGRIEGNQVTCNSSLNGIAGIHISGKDSVVRNNWVNGNVANYYGGILLGDAQCDNNTVVDNVAYLHGGGVTSSGNSPLMRNCIVFGNISKSGLSQIRDVPPILNTNHNCIQGWTGGGVGNIGENPRLVDPEHGDLRLLADSPCIDSGMLIRDLKTDFDGDSRGIKTYLGSQRGDGSNYDMGADEFVSAPAAIGYPAQPVGLSPSKDEVIYTTPSLISSGFGDSNVQARHLSSQWQVSRQADFYSLIYDSGMTPTSLTQTTVPISIFTESGQYFWRVRHADNNYRYSRWSESVSFIYLPSSPIQVPRDYPTIQAAIDAAGDAGDIVVAPGLYKENLLIQGRYIRLHSSRPFDPETIKATIIDGQQLGSVVSFSETGGNSRLIEGFTIRNGKALKGGGICGHTKIRFCHIMDNTAGFGGGIASSGTIVESCIIMRNTATQYGGGLCYCTGPIASCIIAFNTASGSSGVGGAAYNCSFFEGDTIYGNTASKTMGGVYGSTSLDGCILWENSPGQFEKCTNYPGTSYIQTPINPDPQFLDSKNGDFHLLPASPCIDAAVLSSKFDFEGDIRRYAIDMPYYDPASDIGADENVPSFFPRKECIPIRRLTSQAFAYADSIRSAFTTPIPTPLDKQFFMQMNSIEADSTTFTLRVVLAARSSIYIAMDERIQPLPDWLKGWQLAPGELGISNDSYTAKRILLRKDFPKGEITLGPNRNPESPKGCYMYVPIIMRLSESSTGARIEWTNYR